MIIIYSKKDCPNCVKAKALAKDYTEAIIGEDISREDFMILFPEARTVPQIIIDGKHIGGYTELVEYLE
jgi:glutaredoxin 3